LPVRFIVNEEWGNGLENHNLFQLPITNSQFPLNLIIFYCQMLINL